MVVECENDIEAMMALTLDAQGVNSPTRRPVVYVEYISNAPANEPHVLASGQRRRSKGSAINLIATTVELSRMVGLGGWVGLDAIPGADKVYSDWGMVRGPVRRIDGEDLIYFEASHENMCYLTEPKGEQKNSLAS
jgi:hypothetical protein